MNVFTRGIKNSLRSPLRSGAIVLMFAISIALVLSMLVARSSVLTKIAEVKSSAGTSITIRPAGTMGNMGGGTPLTASQLKTVTSTKHIASTVSTLTDQLSSSDTSLTPSLEFGGFGRERLNSSGSSSSSSSDASSSNSTANTNTNRQQMTPQITITGTTDPNSASTNGESLTIKSGSTITATGSDAVALVGSTLAEKNSLSVGSTFTAYNTTITVKGIYSTDNKFQDSGVIMPLATLQTITSQSGVVSSVVAKVDSSDNVSSTVTSLKSSLGSAADITSDVQRAEESVSSLSGIASLAFAGVIAAAIAGGIIILLAMIMVVRERRREIGVMKAIGGTDRKVIGQFMTEGMTLTVIGTMIGMIIGVLVSGPMTTSLVSSSSASSQSSSRQMQGGGMSALRSLSSSSSTSSSQSQGGPGGFIGGGFNQIRNNAIQISATLSPAIIATALGVTFLIALIGTAIPAWITARIRPAEVLRTE